MLFGFFILAQAERKGNRKNLMGDYPSFLDSGGVATQEGLCRIIGKTRRMENYEST